MWQLINQSLRLTFPARYTLPGFEKEDTPRHHTFSINMRTSFVTMGLLAIIAGAAAQSECVCAGCPLSRFGSGVSSSCTHCSSAHCLVADSHPPCVHGRRLYTVYSLLGRKIHVRQEGGRGL